MYILVRTDQSYGQIVVQTAHAVIESTRQYLLANTEHPHLVVCQAKNMEELLAEKACIDEVGIRASLFYEADIGDLPTALATQPVFGDQRKLFRQWKLLR